jgi:SAM-dependent methyltransferase
VEDTTHIDQSAKQAYEAIAPVYDDFTSNHDYELLVAELLPQLRRHGLSEDRLLEVACGAGKSFLPMLARGWRVTACDISPSMLALAEAKAGDAATLEIADMRELPVFGEFDLVWCLDDGLNHLLTTEELVSALEGMRANLAPEGLLLFGVNTLASYNGFFSKTEVVERDGLRLTWRGRASGDVAPGSVCEASFEVQTPAGEPAGEAAYVHQRHFPLAEILDALDKAGLTCLDVFGHGYDAAMQQPLDEALHNKAVYIARRGPDAAN